MLFRSYLRAMEQAGADITPIQKLIQTIKKGTPVKEAIQDSALPKGAKKFAAHTFNLIEKNEPHILAAVFTYGREDLIPEMFASILEKIQPTTGYSIDLAKYYIERHIEVDGGHHSHLATAMTQELCGSDSQKWEAATEAASQALQARIALWDAALTEISQLVTATAIA